MMNVINQPNSQVAVITSLIPFFSPVLMTARLPFDPPLWQVLLSLFLLIGGFVFTTWLAGKIYRIGILMYGKKANLKDLVRWLKDS
jgi:ABC-2 type transport system permease protein